MLQRTGYMVVSIGFEEVPVKGYTGAKSFWPDAWARLPLEEPMHWYQYSEVSERQAVEIGVKRGRNRSEGVYVKDEW